MGSFVVVEWAEPESQPLSRTNNHSVALSGFPPKVEEFFLSLEGDVWEWRCVFCRIYLVDSSTFHVYCISPLPIQPLSGESAVRMGFLFGREVTCVTSSSGMASVPILGIPGLKSWPVINMLLWNGILICWDSSVVLGPHPNHGLFIFYINLLFLNFN